MTELNFHYCGLLVKTLDTSGEQAQGARLRHLVFAERLKWVPERANQLETDSYDALSVSIGVFTPDTQLLSMARLTPAPGPFMLEREFSACLAGTHLIRKAHDTAEVSRLAVDPEIAARGLSTVVIKALFEGMYRWGILNNIRYVYMVSDRRLVRVVTFMGWPFEVVGRPLQLPPARVSSVAALLDITQSTRYRSIQHKEATS